MLTKFKISFFFLIIISCRLYSYEIKSIAINPLNKAIIYFDSIPEINSKLSDDKTKITLSIEKCKFNENHKQISGLGIISDIYIINTDSNTTINIRTKEKRGYTISRFPFSSHIEVDVFAWDKLDTDEDIFRTGLLAEEDKIYEEAFINYYNAAKKGNKQAVQFLALSYLRYGYFKEAEISFKYSYQIDTNNIDALAGLAISTFNLGDTNYSKILINNFRKKCNCPLRLNFELINYVLDSDFLDLRFINIDNLHLFEQNSSLDTNNISKDSTNIAKVETNTPNFFIKFIVDNYELLLFIIGAIGLSVLYLYLKWRQKTLLLIKSKQNENTKNLFNAELDKAKSYVNPKQATNIYQKIEIEDKPKDIAKPDENLINKKTAEKTQSSESPKNQTLAELLDTITKKNIDNETTQNPAANINAKLQLAMHLAEEQRKIKNQNLENLKESSIPTDKRKLSEVSKKLGIEKGGLETKVALEKILKDKDNLKKLSDKFGQ